MVSTECCWWHPDRALNSASVVVGNLLVDGLDELSDMDEVPGVAKLELEL